jgi:hypothetical protein
MAQIKLSLELGWVNTKSQTDELHDLIADSEDQMAQEIVRVW